LPKVGIKLLKISYVRILFLVSFLFVAVVNPYLVFLIFKNSSYNLAISQSTVTYQLLQYVYKVLKCLNNLILKASIFIVGFNFYWIQGCGCHCHVACRSLSQGCYNFVTSKYLCHTVVTTLLLQSIFVTRLLQHCRYHVDGRWPWHKFVTTLYEIVFVWKDGKSIEHNTSIIDKFFVLNTLCTQKLKLWKCLWDFVWIYILELCIIWDRFWSSTQKHNRQL